MGSSSDIGTFEHDGLYSWFVLITIILCNFSSNGFIGGNLGVKSDYYPDIFDEESARTNVISSVASGVFLLTVPIATLVMQVVGCRVIAAAGALLTLSGMVASAYVSQIWHLVLSYSILTAIGASLTYTSSVGIIPHYFKERKAAAYTGLGLGVGIGFTAHPYITSAALDTFGYRMGMFTLLPILIPAVFAPLVFQPQLEKQQNISPQEALSSYVNAFRHFATSFFLLNAFFVIGGRAAMSINYFGYMAENFDPSLAVVAYTIHGMSFLLCLLFFMLYSLKFHMNYFIAYTVVNLSYGIAVFFVPLIRSPIAMFIYSGLLGVGYGISFGFQGNVVSHLFPAKDVTFVYGLTEAVGGVGTIVLPLGIGYIQERYGHDSGFYCIGACCAIAGILLCLAALTRPSLWQAYQTNENESITEDDTKFEEHKAN